jgi:hypothetical protein
VKRRARTAPAGKTRARNIRLSDDVRERLWQLAHSRRMTVSAVADDLLNKSLPRWEVKRPGFAGGAGRHGRRVMVRGVPGGSATNAEVVLPGETLLIGP